MSALGRPADHPGLVGAWIAAIRPPTLLAGVVPVIVGTGLALSDGVFRAGPAVAALLGSILIQIGTNLANDVFDHRSGADNDDRLGPARAAQKGWLTQRELAVGAGVALAGALAVGAWLTVVGGWPIAVLAIVSVLLAIAYTGGPFPLAYHGLGDLFVLLFFGFAATCGTYYVQAGEVSHGALLASVPVGLLATAILVVNNLRDRHTDAAANKRTLAVRMGPAAARGEYTACIAISYAIPGFALLSGDTRVGWLLPLLSLPLAIKQVQAIWTTDGAALNPHLGATARLETVFGLLLAVGLVVTG